MTSGHAHTCAAAAILPAAGTVPGPQALIECVAFQGCGESHEYSPMHQAGLASNNAKAAQVGGLGSLREEACKGGGTERILAQGTL